MKVPPVMLRFLCFVALVGMTLIFYKSSLTVQEVCEWIQIFLTPVLSCAGIDELKYWKAFLTQTYEDC